MRTYRPQSPMVSDIPISKRPTNFNAWFKTQFELSGLSNVELAEQLGVGANMISIWKAGRSPVPMKHIFKLAEIFGADPLYVRNLFFKEFFPGLWKMDEKVRKLSDITIREMEFLEILRSAPVHNPGMNEEQKEEFRRFVSTLSGDGGINENTPDRILKSDKPNKK